MEYKLVYVCSPLSAETEEEKQHNMENAKMYSKIVSYLINCKAIAPHSCLPEILDDENPKERLIAMNICKNILEECDAMFIIGDKISKGMQIEIEHVSGFRFTKTRLWRPDFFPALAKSKNIPIFRLDFTVGAIKVLVGDQS